jgi:hypothetical protein
MFLLNAAAARELAMEINFAERPLYGCSAAVLIFSKPAYITDEWGSAISFVGGCGSAAGGRISVISSDCV